MGIGLQALLAARVGVRPRDRPGRMDEPLHAADQVTRWGWTGPASPGREKASSITVKILDRGCVVVSLEKRFVSLVVDLGVIPRGGI